MLRTSAGDGTWRRGGRCLPWFRATSFRVETGNDGLLDYYFGGVWPVNTFRIVAKLPGISDEEFGRDRQQFSGAMVETEIESGSGYHSVIDRQRPSRDEMAAFEYTIKPSRLGGHKLFIAYGDLRLR